MGCVPLSDRPRVLPLTWGLIKQIGHLMLVEPGLPGLFKSKRRRAARPRQLSAWAIAVALNTAFLRNRVRVALDY